MSNYILTQDGKLYCVSNDELMHYGVKGMKWGVRKYQRIERGVERRAKNISNMIAKTKSIGSEYTVRPTQVEINKLQKQTLKNIKKIDRAIDKFKKRYRNTPYSDIAVKTYAINGRSYVQTLVGRTDDSPYDGSARYRVTAGTWTK